MTCRVCGEDFSQLALNQFGVCQECDRQLAQGAGVTVDPALSYADEIADILVTTEAVLPGLVLKRHDIVSAEAVIGVNLFRDIASMVRDVVGGRNASLQNAMREARSAVLNELKLEAYELGANAVIAVDLDYSEISGGGKSMMLVVATGTAVTLADSE